MKQLTAIWSKPTAVVLTSGAYALAHLKTTFDWPGTGFELVGLFLLGCVLAVSTLRTQQLYLSIGLHASLAYCARVNKMLIDFPWPSMQWLVGTSRLVNGIIAWAALLALGYFISRRGGSKA